MHTNHLEWSDANVSVAYRICAHIYSNWIATSPTAQTATMDNHFSIFASFFLHWNYFNISVIQQRSCVCVRSLRFIFVNTSTSTLQPMQPHTYTPFIFKQKNDNAHTWVHQYSTIQQNNIKDDVVLTQYVVFRHACHVTFSLFSLLLLNKCIHCVHYR